MDFFKNAQVADSRFAFNVEGALSNLKEVSKTIFSDNGFASRSIGSTSSNDGLALLVMTLGHDPISLLGKDYMYIDDHVRRVLQQGYSEENPYHKGCAKFTFYKERPKIRFADPYQDPQRLTDRWFPNASFSTTMERGVTYSYSESKKSGNSDYILVDAKGKTDGAIFSSYESFNVGDKLHGKCDLIRKTNDNFNKGRYDTIIARFHTDNPGDRDKDNPTQTAISSQFGMSHGRNLLKKKPSNENGYDNPYCRVWTYHYQYDRYKKAIRPFSAETQSQLESGFGGIDNISFRTSQDGVMSGSDSLDKHGVLDYETNLVRFAPTRKINEFDGSTDKVDIKRCMFSIENLAWKDIKSIDGKYHEDGLSAEQRGPFGGRIMWFPPYDLTFNENVSVDWNPNKFIGRGEQIYTYSNTDRRGNLSFTLLIDHPSIVDYWEGRDNYPSEDHTVDFTNDETSWYDSSSISDGENRMLRFFAGCEILQAKPQRYEKDVTPEPDAEVTNQPQEIVTEDPQTPEEKQEKPIKKIVAMLYFPNNYSGVDEKWKDGNWVEVNPVHYLVSGVAAQKYLDENGNIKDIQTQYTLEQQAVITNGKQSFGYEMNDSGVSLVDTNRASDYSKKYITNSSGAKVSASCGGKEFTLAKEIGKPKLTNDWTARYLYRCDESYGRVSQHFSDPMSYVDDKSHKLNHSGFAAFKEKEAYNQIYGNFIDGDGNIELISFSDLFVTLEGDGTVVKANGNIGNVRRVLVENPQWVKNVYYGGCASKNGNPTDNERLAKSRAATLKKWFDLQTKDKGIELPAGEIADSNIIIEDPNKSHINKGGQSQESSKVWRNAFIVIEYQEEAEPETYTGNQNADDNVTPLSNNPNLAKWYSSPDELFPYLSSSSLSTWFKENERLKQELLDKEKEEETKDDTHQSQGANNQGKETKKVERYDNEGEFFERLNKDSSLFRNLISQKIRYFDPAFHSISPEGFNARLTFLHQCTRQGSTIEHGNPNEVSAYNLSFGRPPVCVLRIGDFFYTKILINSLDIAYETPQWDLNPEGIGVMPMFAKVSMSFTFIGGSDLAGPIARLQNAVSFNYYANARVYDNRAEMVEYENGKVKNFKGFIYPNNN